MNVICEAVILGSGTSTGVPVPGRAYSDQFLANPKNRRLRPSLLLRGPEGNVVVDAGPDFREQMLRAGVMDIDSVLITHTHADHIMGMDDLRVYCNRSRPAIPVYTIPRYQEDLRRIFDYAFKVFPEGVWVPRFELKDIGDSISLAGIDMQVFWVIHGAMPVMSLRIGSFCYLTDVSEIPDAALPFLQDLDVLILDAVRYEPHPNHFHFDKALAVVEELKPKLTYLTHLSDDYDHDPVEAGLPPHIRLAYDGLTIPILESHP